MIWLPLPVHTRTIERSCLPKGHPLIKRLADMQAAWAPLKNAAPIRDRLHAEVMNGFQDPDQDVTPDTQ